MAKSTDDFQANLRFRVLRLLQGKPEMSYRQIASELGVSVGGIHYCLKALAGKGLIKIRNFRTSDNKFRYAYVVTPDGIAQRAKLTSKFLQQKLTEYENLKAEIEAIQREVNSGGLKGSAE